MTDYEVRGLSPPETAQMDTLLTRSGLKRDTHLDYSAGVFDGERLVATGSCAGNTLRDIAVDPDRQGEGLLNLLLQHLITTQYARGNYHLFLYTKPSSARFFADLGFAEIARDEAHTVFMENRRTGFTRYLAQLVTESGGAAVQPSGALVMNANPFTLGHRYLVEHAAASCETLHLFVVSEDLSVFPAADRMELVRAGTAHLSNVIYHTTGSYLISQATFPSYFLPDGEAATASQARLDAAVFSRIAETLHITQRFLGSEPSSRITALYNDILAALLPQSGIRCDILPRLETGGRCISASTVRQALKEDDWSTAEQMLPPSTLTYLRSPRGASVIERLRGMSDVRHH